MERCAGIIMYRRKGKEVEVLLAHPGGPYYNKQDWWGIPKGHFEEDESPEEVARREFEEETGCRVDGKLTLVGSFLQNENKKVTMYYIEQDYDVKNFKCNECTIEYPRGSGKMITFTENDAIKWFPLKEAGRKVFLGQTRMLRQFALMIGQDNSW